MTSERDAILDLSHRIGQRGDLAVLAEGNTSIRLRDDADRFLVKASGHSLATLGADGLVECRLSALLPFVEGQAAVADGEVGRVLRESRCHADAAKPSVEAFFHAALLSLPGVNVVAHAHPEAVNAVLCSPRAGEFAAHRYCPDEVVCCGAESVLVPYVDPGLELARVMLRSVREFARRRATVPKVILLANHGVVCPAGTVEGAWAAMVMCVKAAKVFAGACALGGAVPMAEDEVARIDGRADEAHRRALLGL